MKLKLSIAPAQVTTKKGWFSSSTIDVHRLTIDLQLTDTEIDIVEKAGIMGQPLVTVDPEATGLELASLQNAYRQTGGRPYMTLQGIIRHGRNTGDYMSLPGAQKALEEVKQELIGLKAMLERAADPSANTFEL